jgi:hypothetical protein
MTKFVLLAALIAASSSPSFAQGVPPVAHKQAAGYVDTLLRNAAAMRCKIGREINEKALSNCRQEQGRE